MILIYLLLLFFIAFMLSPAAVFPRHGIVTPWFQESSPATRSSSASHSPTLLISDNVSSRIASSPLSFSLPRRFR